MVSAPWTSTTDPHFGAAGNTRQEVRREERAGFAPCPTCRQYSHSLSEDAVAEAFMHFQSMLSHRGDGIPTQFTFDAKTRDAAQVLMAAHRRIPNRPEPKEWR